MHNKALTWFKKNINKVPSPFEYSYADQEQYINTFLPATDLIERSFYQYKCQIRYKNKFSILVLNILSFFGVIVFSLSHLKKSSKVKSVPGNLNSKLALFPFKGSYENIIPDELKSEFEILEIYFDKNKFLTISDFSFLKQVWLRYPFNFYFLLKVIYKVSIYRSMIFEYNPQAIIVASEYSFTSSILTLYCRLNNVCHINVMHGEKMLNSRDSFFQFDRCYVWDEHYIKLFEELKAASDQFIVSTSNPFYFNLPEGIDNVYYATYYLAAENEEQMNRIKDMLLMSNFSGENICIRFHPRYTDFDLAKQIFSDYFIELPHLVPIRESLEKTKNVISFFSTVLYMGYVNNKNIFIDDVTTDQKQYGKLKELKYIMLSKPHKKMSELLKNENNG